MEFNTFICTQLFIYIFRVGGTASNRSACRDELYPNLWPTVSLRYGGKLNSLKLWSRERSPCCRWPAGTGFAMFCSVSFTFTTPVLSPQIGLFHSVFRGGSKGDAKHLRQKSNGTETSAPLRHNVSMWSAGTHSWCGKAWLCRSSQVLVSLWAVSDNLSDNVNQILMCTYSGSAKAKS